MNHARRCADSFAGISQRLGGFWRSTTVVDFTRETPIDVRTAAVLCMVNPVTIRRWFARGLEFCKLGGKVLTSREAINRFRQDGGTAPVVQAIVVDQETLAAIRRLKSHGITFAPEGVRDGSGRAKAKAAS